MSLERKPELHLEIAHVLFMDVVGFSKLLINDQTEILDLLNQIVRKTPQFAEAEAAGKLIRLATGDGMALVFSNSAEAPVECALEISEALKTHPQIQLRMGIHSGPVNAVSDVNDRSNVTGAGINIAQRVMDCGDAGHILLSRRVAEDLEQYRQWQPCLHDLGECEVKHGAHVHVFNLYTDGVGNPEVPEKLQQARAKEQTPPAAATSAKFAGRSRAWIAALVIVAAAIAVAGFYIFSHRSSSKAILEKSIAVLPFANLSRDPDNAYFADGIQDEILTRLSKIADLKVISRTSTQDYKSAPKNLPEIARQLGVATILEGSVQKAGEAVHISVQLVDGRNDAHIWAESYDRELKNIFGVEREVAETVARQLKARLLPRETNELARVPTKNLQAYDLYLRGRYVTEQAWNLQVDSEKPAADFFKQAIALDPGFALAYAALARAEWGSYVTGDYSPERLAEVQANVEKSLALQSDLVEGHLVRAKIYSYVKHDNARALAECEPLLQRFPNNAELVMALASGKGKAGDWQAELAGLQRAVELDPRNTKYLRYLADKYMSLRRFSEAEQTYQREIILASDDWTARFNRALNLINQGRLSEAREATMAMPDTKLMTLTLALKYSDLQLIETYTRDYDAALSAAAKIPALNRVPTQAVPAGNIKKHTDTGFDLLYRGDEVGARQEFIQARDSLEAQRPGHLEDVDFHNADALAEAGLGDRIAALKAARKTVELAPIEDDVHNGSVYLLTLAQVHAHFGEADEAIRLVEKLLNLPVTGDIITTAVLRLDPIWDPIRSDPRFQKLVAAPAPK